MRYWRALIIVAVIYVLPSVVAAQDIVMPNVRVLLSTDTADDIAPLLQSLRHAGVTVTTRIIDGQEVGADDVARETKSVREVGLKAYDDLDFLLLETIAEQATDDDRSSPQIARDYADGLMLKVLLADAESDIVAARGVLQELFAVAPGYELPNIVPDNLQDQWNNWGSPYYGGSVTAAIEVNGSLLPTGWTGSVYGWIRRPEYAAYMFVDMPLDMATIDAMLPSQVRGPSTRRSADLVITILGSDAARLGLRTSPLIHYDGIDYALQRNEVPQSIEALQSLVGLVKPVDLDTYSSGSTDVGWWQSNKKWVWGLVGGAVAAGTAAGVVSVTQQPGSVTVLW